MIEAFLAVVNTGSISAASEELFLSQSTISYRLKALEDELEVVLFDRAPGKRSTDLTIAGESFLEYAERWVHLNEEIKNLKNIVPQFHLEIAAVDSLNLYVFNEAYKLFSKKLPDAKIRIRTQQSHEIYSLINRLEVDLGFVLKPLNYDNIVVKSIFEEEMKLIRKKRNTKKTEISPKELNKRDELYVAWSPDYINWHNNYWDPGIPPYLWIDSVPLMKFFLNEERFWAIAPQSAINNLKQDLDLEVLNLTTPPPLRITYMIHHKNLQTVTKKNINIFIDILKRSLPQKIIK